MPNYYESNGVTYIPDVRLNVKDSPYGALGNGVTDDTVAIQAAIDALPAGLTGGGIVFFPPGRYLISASLVLTGRSHVHLVGSGTSSQIYTTAPMTEMVRMVDCKTSGIRDLYFKANHAVSLAMVHVTAVISGERNNVERVFCEGNSLADVCFGVSLDYATDTSEINFVSCWATAAVSAGWKGGNGVYGNVLDVRCYGCDSRNSKIGIWMDGCTFSWHGGSLLGNAVSDCYLTTAVTHPVLIQGVRSEGSGRFWEVLNGVGGSTSVELSNIAIGSFTGQAYTIAGSTFTPQAGVVDGQIIIHQSSIPITVRNMSVIGVPVGHAVTYKFTTGSSYLYVVLDNVSGITAGAGTLASMLTTSANTHLTILPGARIDGSGGTHQSEVGLYCTDLMTTATGVVTPAYTTTARNALTGLTPYQQVFDLTLNKPIWRNTANSAWLDATGAAV